MKPVLKGLVPCCYLNLLRPLGADKQTVIKHKGKLMAPVNYSYSLIMANYFQKATSPPPSFFFFFFETTLL